MKRFLPLLCSSALLCGCATTPSHLAGRECFHGAGNVEFEKEFNYCQAVRDGDTLYISGTVGRGEMGSAVKKAYSVLEKTLAARGLSFRNVVKETVYTTNLDELIKHKDARKPFYGDATPAATWVQVSRLFDPEFVIEVELVAKYDR